MIENLGTLNPNVARCGSNCLFNWWDRGFLAFEHGVERGGFARHRFSVLFVHPITSSCLFMWRVHLQEMFEETLG